MITTWVYSMDAAMTMTGDDQKMSVDDANVQTTHKENDVSRINRDGHDRQSQRATLESCIDPMAKVSPATGCFMNISNCQTSMLTKHWRLDVDSSISLRHHGQTAILIYFFMYQLVFG